LPSRFRFEVFNEQLYNFQIQNPGWDPFIKTLLRSYGGAFDNYVRLREFDLSKRSHMNTQQVIEGLNKLQEYGILNYLPQTDHPQVTWIKPRMDADNLHINKAYIETRKANYRNKIEAVFAYSLHRRCRSQMLLAYFDETNAPKCGICDICLEEKRQLNAAEIGDVITNEIVELLSVSSLDASELITSLKNGVEKERIETIRMLLDAGKIKSDGVVYYL